MKSSTHPAARRALIALLLVIAAFYSFIAGSLFLLRWIDPPTTSVQIERRVHAWFHHSPYAKHYEFIPLADISPSLQHAVIAAEDAGFYRNHGVAWRDLGRAIDEDIADGRHLGASTIEQQLARNLFLSTHRSVLRKAVEFSIVPLMELLLPKRRILELYLNVIEWGPGIYGAEAASRTYYHIPASRITREQGIALAEVLPSPRHRTPGKMRSYGVRIQHRMNELGW